MSYDAQCIFCHRMPTVWDEGFTTRWPNGRLPHGWHPACYDKEFGDGIADPLRLRVRDGKVEWAGR